MFLGELFAAGPGALGCVMAGSAERIVGDPGRVAASVHALAADLVEALEGRETAQDVAACREAKAADGGGRVSLDEVRRDLSS